MAAPAIVAPVVLAPAPESVLTIPVPPVEDWTEEYAQRERLWTGADLERAYEVGLFSPDERYELLEGRLLKKMPQNNPHATTVARLSRALLAIFGLEAAVYDQASVNKNTTSKPEPDVTLLPGTLDDWDGKDWGSEDVLLAVEVSDTTLRLDRGYKAGLYARMGFAEVWIVDVNGRRVEVRRGPMSDGGWSLTQIFGEGDALAVPGSERTIAVADVLPRVQE